jgi:hypothetical protein
MEFQCHESWAQMTLRVCRFTTHKRTVSAGFLLFGKKLRWRTFQFQLEWLTCSRRCRNRLLCLCIKKSFQAPTTHSPESLGAISVVKQSTTIHGKSRTRAQDSSRGSSHVPIERRINSSLSHEKTTVRRLIQLLDLFICLTDRTLDGLALRARFLPRLSLVFLCFSRYLHIITWYIKLTSRAAERSQNKSVRRGKRRSEALAVSHLHHHLTVKEADLFFGFHQIRPTDLLNTLRWWWSQEIV